MSDLIFIVGRQRSGTTVFRDLICRNGALNCDEIMHGDLTRPYRFYGYVQRRVEADQTLIHPQSHPSLFWDYIQDLQAEANGRKIAMDVKYFGLSLIPQRDNVANEQPFLLGFMNNQQANVVHIIRRNKLRIFVSEKLAAQTGIWSAEQTHQLPSEKPKLTVDPQEALQNVNLMIQQDTRVTNWLDEQKNCHRIFYDAMFDAQGQFTPHVQDLAQKVMETPGDYATPGNLKMNPEGLSDLIENYADVARVFEDTDHAWMLTDLN